MKLIGPAAVFAVVFSLPVPGLAQGDKPAAKPAATKPEAAAAQPAAKPAAKPKPAAAKPEAAKPAAKPEAAKPEAAAAKPAIKLAASDSPKRSRASEDARSCLEMTTNIEIHKCAEKYR